MGRRQVHSRTRTAAGHRGVPVPAGVASPPEPQRFGADARRGAHRRSRFRIGCRSSRSQDRTGKATPISSFAGKSLVINFWATWCAPCRSEIPLLKGLNTEWADRDVSVIGIAVDHRDKVLEFADALQNRTIRCSSGSRTPWMPPPRSASRPRYSPSRCSPTAAARWSRYSSGELHRPQAELILSQVQNLNQGRCLGLAAARAAPSPQGLRALRNNRS